MHDSLFDLAAATAMDEDNRTPEFRSGELHVLATGVVFDVQGAHVVKYGFPKVLRRGWTFVPNKVAWKMAEDVVIHAGLDGALRGYGDERMWPVRVESVSVGKSGGLDVVGVLL